MGLLQNFKNSPVHSSLVFVPILILVSSHCQFFPKSDLLLRSLCIIKKRWQTKIRLSSQVSVYHQRKIKTNLFIRGHVSESNSKAKILINEVYRKQSKIKKVNNLHIYRTELGKIRWIFVSIMADANTLLVLSYEQMPLHHRFPQTGKKTAKNLWKLTSVSAGPEIFMVQYEIQNWSP